MRTLRIAVVLFVTAFLLSAPAGARAQNPTPTPARSARPTGLRLAADRLRSCQAREAAIKTRMSGLVRFVANMEDKFDAISQRVQNFYAVKVLPTGKTLDNYDVLVAEIDSKKAAVDSLLAKTQEEASGFSCDSDDPRGLYTQFRTNMQAIKSALHEYRTAIRDLIVAVHRLAPTPAPEAGGTE